MKTITTLIYHAARKILKQVAAADLKGQHDGHKHSTTDREMLKQVQHDKRKHTTVQKKIATLATTAVLLFTAQACINLPDPIAELKNIVKAEEKTMVEFDHYVVVADDNNDHITQQGETVTITVYLENTGNSIANNVYATFNTYNTYVYNLDPTTPISFGNIQPNNNNAALTNLCFSVNNSTPPNTQISFIANVTDDKGNKWETTFNVIVQQAILPIINEYSDHDENKLKNFLKQNSSTEGLLNGHKLGLSDSDMNNWDDNEQWISKLQGVTWNYDYPRRILEIMEWDAKELAGNLDLEECTALTTLNCDGNQLNALDLTNCTALTMLSCFGNQLTQLDVTTCTRLADLQCSINQLTQLDVSKCTGLTQLHCGVNQLEELNVSECTMLTQLDFFINPINSVTFGWTTPPTFVFLTLPDDLSNATLFVPQGSKQLYLNTEPWNKFGTVSDGTNTDEPTTTDNYIVNISTEYNLTASTNTGTTTNGNFNFNVTTAQIYDNPIWIINATDPYGNNINIQHELTGPNNYGQFTVHLYNIQQNVNVHVSYNNQSEQTQPDNNQYHDDDEQMLRNFLSQGSNAQKLGLTTTDINSWYDNEDWVEKVEGVEWNYDEPRRIRQIYWGDKGLTGNLNLAGTAQIVWLDCYNNQLTQLNVSNCPLLNTLYCYDNQLTQLNIDGSTQLTEFRCYNNMLTTLNVSRHTALEGLICLENPITDLYVGWNYPPNIDDRRLGLPDPSNATLHVPTGAVYNYRNHQQWKEFYVITDGYTTDQLTPAVNNIYHDDDEQMLRNFLQQGSNAQRLGLTTADINSWYDNEDWIEKLQGVEWNYDEPRRIRQIYWGDKGLTGNLSLAGAAQLVRLDCYNNQLTQLNVSNCPQLHTFYCNDNQLTQLNATNCTMVEDFRCSNNQLTTLDLTNNNAINLLYCYDNPINDLTVPWINPNNINIGLPNVSNATLHVPTGSVYNYRNQQPWNEFKVITDGITADDGTAPTEPNTPVSNVYHDHDKNALRNFLEQSNNAQQTGLSTDDVNNWHDNEDWIDKIQGVNWNNDSPKRLSSISWVWKELAGNLDLNECTALIQVQCYGNQLTNLNVSNCTNLTLVNANINQLHTLNAGNCTNLTELSCSENQVTQLNISNCTALTDLNCLDNQLTQLDVSHCTDLIRLYCEINKLNALNVDNCTTLKWFNCFDNQLTQLDIKHCTALASLDCHNNPLNNLAVGWNTPPALSHLQLTDETDNATLYVPTGTVENYRNTPPWNRFGNFAEW